MGRDKMIPPRPIASAAPSRKQSTMLVYWSMFAVSALSTLIIGGRRTLLRDELKPGLAFVLLAFTLLIGLRFQVGTDWFNYQIALNRLAYVPFTAALSYKDPGFGMLGWAAMRTSNGLIVTNFVCATIFMWGVARFAKAQPDQWMAVTAAVPYLLIVVGMGYTRQAAAIGFELLALLAFERKQYAKFFGWLFLGALFHGSAIVILPFAVVAFCRTHRNLILPIAFLSTIVFAAILAHRFNNLYSLYVSRQNSFDSSGAFVRLIMNAIPSLIFLINRNRMIANDESRFLWLLLSIISLALVPILAVFPSSTAVDRVSLYFIPIQMLVFGRLPIIFGQTPQGERMVSFGIVLYYGAALFVWLQFANNAHAWLPYHFAPLTAPAVQSDSGF